MLSPLASRTPSTQYLPACCFVGPPGRRRKSATIRHQPPSCGVPSQLLGNKRDGPHVEPSREANSAQSRPADGTQKSWPHTLSTATRKPPTALRPKCLHAHRPNFHKGSSGSQPSSTKPGALKRRPTGLRPCVLMGPIDPASTNAKRLTPSHNHRHKPEFTGWPTTAHLQQVRGARSPPQKSSVPKSMPAIPIASLTALSTNSKAHLPNWARKSAKPGGRGSVTRTPPGWPPVTPAPPATCSSEITGWIFL